jgi:hypothetical protein
VRVRFGKHTELLDAGCNVKLPFVDSYYIMGDYAQVFQSGTSLHTESENPK